jgi:hypothetical protein
MKISQLLIGLVAGVLSLAALAQEPIVIKFSHVVAPSTRRKARRRNCSPRRRPN